MSLNTRPRSPPPSIWGERIGHNGGPWHDGPPQRARPRAEGEEESQGGRRTTPNKEEPREKASLRRSDGSVAPQPPKRALTTIVLPQIREPRAGCRLGAQAEAEEAPWLRALPVPPSDSGTTSGRGRRLGTTPGYTRSAWKRSRRPRG